MASTTLFVLIAAIISSCVQSSQAVTVVLVPPGSAVIRGRFTYGCQVPLNDGGRNLTQIEWYHNSTLVSDQRVTLTDTNNSTHVGSKLQVRRSIIEDEGEYYCRAMFSGGVEPVSSDLHILQLRGIFAIHVEPVVEALLGSIVQLRCKVDAANPDISWSRIENDDNGIAPTSTDANVGILETNITWGDNGTWYCNAFNEGGSHDQSFQVVVMAPPSTSVSPASHSSNPTLKGSDFTLECRAVSYPNSSFTWTFNGTYNLNELSQESGSRYEMSIMHESSNTSTSFLTVRNSTFEDNGVYACTATNRLGTDSANISISVEGPPRILTEQTTTSPRVGITSFLYLHCPFIGNPPPSVTWRRGQTSLTLSDQYHIFDNGSLFISSTESVDSTTFTCTVSNSYGSDAREFIVTVVDRPNPPTNFQVTGVQGNTRSVQLTWNAPSGTESNNAPEEYVVEHQIEGEQDYEAREVLTNDVTSTLFEDLLPGVRYYFRVRAINIGGESEPSTVRTYQPPAAPPLLTYFNATALEGGRSVLLAWELEYSGAPQLNNFTVEVVSGGVVVRTLELNSSLVFGSEVVTGLNHESSYSFSATLVNSANMNAVYTSRATTTMAPPSKPSRPTVVSTTTTSIRISFTVKFGSQRITHFLLNMTQPESGEESQTRMSLDETKYIDSIAETVDTRGSADGLEVVMFLTGLTEREVYEFEVAAESSVGVGEFSEPSPAAKLEDDRILYYIIGCVVCGVLLVVVGIVIVATFTYGKQRYNQRRKTIKINSSGNHAFLPEDTDHGMPLKSPTVDRHHSRDTLTSTSNGYFNTSFHATSISKSDSYSRDGLSPPTYNQIGEFPVTNGGMTSPMGIKMDTVIDMPENSTQIQTHFVGGKVAQNPQYNVHVLGHQHQQQHSPRPAHMQLTLQTSLSDIQHHVDSPTPDKAMGSLSSERQFLSNSHLLSVHAPVLSRSNPTIGTRYPCDNVMLPGPTSQATDV